MFHEIILAYAMGTHIFPHWAIVYHKNHPLILLCLVITTLDRMEIDNMEIDIVNIIIICYSENHRDSYGK